MSNSIGIWARDPNRVIHAIVSAAVVIAAIAADLANALNGTQTWIGVGMAVLNVAQGEWSRSQSRPVQLSTPIPVTQIDTGVTAPAAKP